MTVAATDMQPDSAAEAVEKWVGVQRNVGRHCLEPLSEDL